MKEMKTLTIKGETFETVDAKARKELIEIANDVKKIKEQEGASFTVDADGNAQIR